jgi:TRAP-type C4-dicarboxylate transport system substrate-binding protein
VFEDDVPDNQEAAKTPHFEKPDDQIDSSTWAQPVDPSKFIKNTTPDASVHSGPILWQNHRDAHSVLNELKEYHEEAMKHQKAYLVCLEKWQKLHDSVACLASPALFRG